MIEIEGTAETPLLAGGLVCVPNTDPPTPTVAVINPESRQIVELVPTGEMGFTPVELAGFVWVPNRASATVTRVDMETFETLDIPLSPGFVGLSVVGDHIETRAAENYWRIDVDGTATVIEDPGPLPVEFDGAVFRVDPSRTAVERLVGDAVEATIQTGAGTSGLAVAGDWIFASTTAGFVRIDPVSGDVSSDPILVDGFQGFVGSDDGLWVHTRGERPSVTFIDGETLLFASVPVSGSPDEPTIVDDRAFVSLILGASAVEEIVPRFATDE